MCLDFTVFNQTLKDGSILRSKLSGDLLGRLHVVVAGHHEAVALDGGLHLGVLEVVRRAVVAEEEGLINLVDGGDTELLQGALDLLVVARGLVLGLDGAADGTLTASADGGRALLQHLDRDLGHRWTK